jgi:hypothetical protein
MFNEFTMTDGIAFKVAAAIYGGAFLFGLISLLMRRAYSRTIMFALLCGGFLIQTLALNLRGAEIKACPLGNPFEIAQFLAWSLVLLFFIIGPAFRLRLLGGFTAGLGHNTQCRFFYHSIMGSRLPARHFRREPLDRVACRARHI